jgi:tetratricopeptide (TPR) repeat protein
MQEKRQLDDAIEYFRKGIELAPQEGLAHAALADAVMEKGNYVSARTLLARALKMLPEGHMARANVARQLQDCERFLRLSDRLDRVLAGQDKAGSSQQVLDVATMCHHQRKHVSAVRFFGDAFAAHPAFADDLGAGHRYNAACSASQAAAGLSENSGQLDAKERCRICRQALDWLRADLLLHAKQLASKAPGDRARSVQGLRRWQQDPYLAGIREVSALAKLSADERAACARLWADVAALLKKAEAPAQKEGQ